MGLHGYFLLNHWKIHITLTLEAQIHRMPLEVMMLMAQFVLN